MAAAEAKASTLSQSLKVNPRVLSSAKRRKSSAPDDRKSSQMTGAAAVLVCLGVTVGMVVSVDLLSILIWCHRGSPENSKDNNL